MFFFSKSGVGPGEEPSSIPITEFRTAGHDKRAVPLTPLGAGWGGAPGRLSRVRSAEVGRDRLGRGSRGPRSARAPPPGLSHRVARVPTPGCCAERGRDASGALGALAAWGSRPPGGAARDLLGRSAACAPGPPWRSPGRGSASSSCSSTPPRRGERGPGGRQWGRPGRSRRSPAGRGRLPGPGAASGSGGRGPGDAPRGAERPGPAAGLRGRPWEKRVRRPGRGHPRPRKDLGEELRPPSDPVPR